MKQAVILPFDTYEIVLKSPKERLKDSIEKIINKKRIEIHKQDKALRVRQEKIIQAEILLKEKEDQIIIANQKLFDSEKKIKILHKLKARIKKLLIKNQKHKEKYATILGFNTKNIESSNMDTIFLKQCLNHIKDNLLNTKWNITEFSNSMNMSRSQLYKKIKTLTQMSISEYILSVRLKIAAQFLENNTGTITEIAFKVGFNDSSYFSKCFKKKYDITPS